MLGIVFAWDLDRAYRSTLEALNELSAIHKRGVNFTIANLRLDATTPEGYWAFTVMSANAELERRTLSRRTNEGLEAARRRGARLGRPPVMTPDQIRTAREQIEVGGRTKASVARAMKVPRWTLARSLKRQEMAQA